MRKKQTKIVATIGIKRDVEFIEAMYRAGADVMRLNTAHQDTKEALAVINNIRQVSDRIAILIDTKGPEVRVTQLAEDLVCTKGMELKMAGTADQLASSPEKIYVNYADFHKDMLTGAVIFIDDGKLELKVEKKTANYLLCKVMNDGLIKSNKSVNVPGVHLNLPTLNKKDKSLLIFLSNIR